LRALPADTVLVVPVQPALLRALLVSMALLVLTMLPALQFSLRQLQ